MTVLSSRSATTSRPARPSPAARRFGYVVAALVNAALLYAVHRWPGWDAVPFLTSETEAVLPAVSASLVAALVANALYLGHDPLWFRALGDVVTTAFGLFALTRLWVVFPVEVAGSGPDWALVLRILLGLGIVGTVAGLLTAVAHLVLALRPRG